MAKQLNFEYKGRPYCLEYTRTTVTNMEAMGFELNGDMMNMLGGFTILRMLGMAGGMLGIEISKEELLALNAKLNKIKAPKKKD